LRAGIEQRVNDTGTANNAPLNAATSVRAGLHVSTTPPGVNSHSAGEIVIKTLLFTMAGSALNE
jgi:hypothetical protein